MRIAPFFLFSVFVLATAASAQPKFGDWVVGDSFRNHGGILYMDPTQTPPSPLTSLIVGGGAQGNVNSVSMHPNNRDFLVGFSALSALALVDLNGTIVSLATIPGGASGHAKAEDGSVFVVVGADIYRANLATGTSAKFNTSALPPLLTDVTIDHATGDLIAGALSAVVVLDAKTGAIKRTMTTAIPSPYRVEHDPVSDQFFVAEGARSAWNRLDRNGTVIWTQINISAGGLKSLEQQGTILTGALNRIAVMDTNGSVVGGQDHMYPRSPVTYKFDSIEVYGSAHLNGSGSGQAGTAYSLNVSFPQASQNDPYQVAASLTGHRPGFPLPNGDIVSLAPDPLFFLLLSTGSIPGLFDNFSGLLDPFGNPAGPKPTVNIPAGFPAGVRLFLQAYVLSAAIPGGIALSNTWAFTTG